jgi:hypothetical protein
MATLNSSPYYLTIPRTPTTSSAAWALRSCGNAEPLALKLCPDLQIHLNSHYDHALGGDVVHVGAARGIARQEREQPFAP